VRLDPTVFPLPDSEWVMCFKPANQSYPPVLSVREEETLAPPTKDRPSATKLIRPRLSAQS